MFVSLTAKPPQKVKDVLGYIRGVAPRGWGQRQLVDAAGGLKAFIPLYHVLMAGVLFLVSNGFVAGCG